MVLTSECEPTRFEVVAALLWKCVAKAASKLFECSLGKPFNLGVIINIRGKNCVPKNSVGNLIWPGLAQCKLSPELEHKTLVNQIKKCKAEINDDFVEAIKGDDGTLTFAKITEMMTSEETTFSLWLTSMCNIGLNELDFGWGKPAIYGNFISLCDAGAGGGIQAIVSLSKEHMAIFENDPELLAFASVNPAPL